MDSETTFELAWTRAGLAGRTGLAQDATIRPDEPFVTTQERSLPTLTIGAVDDHERTSGADLEILGKLGEGGMGVVHLARQHSLDREVAVKQAHTGALTRSAVALLHEARIMGHLEHPNIVPVHALGLDSAEKPVLVMKRVEGVSWRTLIRVPSHAWWSTDVAGTKDRLSRHLEILLSVCRAVQFAHTRGVLHLDLKPENIMLGAFGEVYVLDWGVAARLDRVNTRPRAVAGTPAYMAPEMLELSMPLSPATDVYLLGACLHEVLTGHPRHKGADVEAVMRSVHASEPFVFGPETPCELAELVNRACARDPSERFESVDAFQRIVAWNLGHRASLQLAQAAAERLDRLKDLLGAPSPESGARTRAEALFTESRFGFQQALHTCHQNDVARDGLKNALAAMAPYKLSHGDLDGALALAEELDGLGSDTTTLRESISSARASAECLAAAVRNADVRAYARERAFGATALGLVFCVFSGVIVWNAGNRADAYDAVDAVWFMLIANTIGWSAAFLGRRWVLATAMNRSLAGIGLVALAASLVHRVLAVRFGTPTPMLLATDLVIFTAMGGAYAVLLPGAWQICLPLLTGALAIALWPNQMLGLFSAAMLLATALAGHVVWRLARGQGGT